MSKQPRGGLLWRVARRLTRLVGRFFGIIFVFLMLSSIGTALYLRHAFDSEKIKAVLATQIQEILHRPVQIEGLIITPRGLKLRGLKVIERLDMPGNAMIDCDFAVITIKPLPLLYGRVEFGHVLLSAPRIQIVRNQAGEWSLSDLFVSSRPAASRWGPLALPFALAAARTEIEDGLLTIDDRKDVQRNTIERFDLVVSNFDVRDPFDFKVSFDNVNSLGRQSVASSWKLQGKMRLAGFDWAQAFIDAQRVAVSVDGLPVSGSARLANFSRPALDVELRVAAFERSRWRKYLPDSPDLVLPASRWRGRVSLDEARGLRFERVRLEAGPLSVGASGRLDLAGARPALRVQASLGDFPMARAREFTGFFSSYGVTGVLGGEAALAWEKDRWRVRQTRLKWRGARAAWDGKRWAGDVALVASDDFTTYSIDVAGGTLEAFGTTFTDAALSARFADGLLSLKDATVRWGTSTLKLKAQVRDPANMKEIMFKGELDRIRWESAQSLVESIFPEISSRTAPAAVVPKTGAPQTPLVRAFKYSIPKKFPDTTAKVTVGEISHRNFNIKNVDLFWKIRGVSPSLKYVSGDALLNFGPGRIADIAAVQKAHRFVEIILIPFVFMHKMNKLSAFSIATAYPTTLDFNRIGGQYVMQSGVATTRYFHVDSPQLVAYADGMADFVKESVDMNILTRLPEYKGVLPEFFKDEAGRTAIGFRVKGNLASPDLDYRMTKMKADEIEKALSEAMGRAAKDFEPEEKLRRL